MQPNFATKALALAVLAVGTAQPTLAQESRRALEEVVVTARKQEESIQSVPVAVTAMSADQLAATSTFTVNALAKATPSLNITVGAGDPNSSVVALRGQVQNDTLLTLDPSVGIYLDDVYLGHSVGSNLDLFDMDRVEILAGPQGTLYGRNTTGGAIKLISKKADPSAGYTGYISQAFGNYDNSRTEAAANIPLIEDVLAMRVALMHHERDGYGIYNIVDPITQDVLKRHEARDKNADGARLNIVYHATDRLSFTLAGDYSDTRNGGDFRYNMPGEIRLDASTYVRSTDNHFRANSNFANFADARVRGGSLTADYGFDFVDFKMIYAYRDVDTGYGADIDGTSSVDVFANSILYKNVAQQSLELQLTGSSFDDRLSWVAGLYWFDEEGTDISTSYAGTYTNQNMRVVGGRVESTSISPYVHTAYNFLDDFTLTVGVRYTEDEKGFRGQAYNPPQAQFPAGRCIYDGLPDPSPSTCFFDQEKDWDNISYTVGIDWQITPDIMVYLKRNTGYRSGGQNLRGYDQITQQPFDEETIGDWEVGVKSTLLDQRLRLNASAYRSEYEDI